MSEQDAPQLNLDAAAYFDGELGAADHARIEEAIASDPELKAELENWKRLDAGFNEPEGLSPRAPPVSELQWQKTWQGIREQTHPHASASKKEHPRILKIVAFVAAAAAIVVLCVTLLGIRQRRLNLPKNIAKTAPTVETTEAGDGFKALEPEMAGDTLRIDFEAFGE